MKVMFPHSVTLWLGARKLYMQANERTLRKKFYETKKQLNKFIEDSSNSEMTRLLPSFKSVSFPRKIRRSSYICYFMPMGSQQTTISTCLHLSLRPLHILDMADVINVNVTYNKKKRIISYQKDGDVQGFCHLFLHVFSDVLPSKVTPIQV